MDPQAIASQLIPIVQHVVTGVMNAGDSGVLGKVKEAGAAVGYVREAATRFEGNAILDHVIKNITGDGAKDFATAIGGGQFDLSQMNTAVSSLNTVLNGMGSTGREIKEFVVELAQKIAEAAGGGLLGSGQKMSSGEFRFIDDLKRQLDIV